MELISSKKGHTAKEVQLAMRYAKWPLFPGAINHGNHVGAWWLTYPSEKYEFVSLDDDIPNIWKNRTCSKPPGW